MITRMYTIEIIPIVSFTNPAFVPHLVGRWELWDHKLRQVVDFRRISSVESGLLRFSELLTSYEKLRVGRSKSG